MTVDEGVQSFLLTGFNKIGALNAEANGHPKCKPALQLAPHRLVLGEGVLGPRS